MNKNRLGCLLPYLVLCTALTACQSDLIGDSIPCEEECPAGTYCNDSGECVEDDSDNECPSSCPKGRYCDETTNGKCVKNSQKECPDSCPKGKHCDKTTDGICVDDEDDQECPDSCPAGQHCDESTNGICVNDILKPTCPDSCPAGQHCDASTNGICVDDVVQTQCPDSCPTGQHCDNTTNGICVDDVVQIQCPDSCPTGQHCDDTTNGICVPDTTKECNPGELKCKGNMLQKCSSNNLFEDSENCSQQGKTCQNGKNGYACYEQGCVTGTSKCAGTVVSVCNASHEYEKSKDCASTKDTPVCVEANSQAKCGCQKGERKCEGNNAMVCNDSGEFVVEHACSEYQKCYIEQKHTHCIVDRTLNVLILEIDPVLTSGSIQGKNCKNLKASECLGQNNSQAVNELVEDIQFSSHQTVKVNIVKTDSTNEFAVYKNQVNLTNGKKDYKYDQATWLDMMKNGWYAALSDSRWKDLEGFSFDYNYYINKYNLINRRKNNEFNEVWIVNVDPVMTYESILVGKNAYWINGKQIEADCLPFKIMNVSISRPDANYECFGHATENILTQTFSKTMGAGYNPQNWDKDSINITSSNYSKLNLWQKFMLTEWENKSKNTGLTGVGNMHYSPNSVTDYDWNNTTSTNVKSKWQEWNNYPNITNNASSSVFSVSAYMNDSVSGTKSDARKHHRWWFGLFPHIIGYTKDGYSNNWWDYFVTNDFVTKITSSKTSYTFSVGDRVDIEVEVTYHSNKKEKLRLRGDEWNVLLDNLSCIVQDENGNLLAKAAGTTKLTYYRDGIPLTVTVNVK